MSDLARQRRSRSWMATSFFALACAGIGGALVHWGPWAYDSAHAAIQSRRGATTQPTSRPAAEAASVDTWIVKRDDLRITFTESGKLRAIKSYPIIPQISRQQLKISFLAAEGATVKKDELIVSFDKKAFEDQLQARKADLEGANRQIVVNQSALQIAESTGKTNVKLAQTRLEDAKVALKTYLELDGPKRLNELDRSINEAREKVTVAQKTVVDSQSKIDEGLFSEEEQKKGLERELADSKRSLSTLQKSVNALTLQRKIFRAYEYPQSIRSKRQAVEGATMEVEKSKVQADSDLNQRRAEVARTQDTINRLTRDVETFTDTIAKCDITAPVDGLVVYGDPSRQYYMNEQSVKVGADWFGGQTLMTIPDLSAFEIDVNLAESYVGRVRAGASATITFDAVPNLKIDGSLKEVAKLGRPREVYDPNSPRVFGGVISLEGADERLVSGMTGRVEILADEIKDALLVPVDAILSESGKTFVNIRAAGGKIERREVTVGRSNNTLVEITAGLDEGERIALGVDSTQPTK